MDNFGNSFSNDFDENYNLPPAPRRRISCSQIVSLLGLLVAILAFLFGDNILGRKHREETPAPETISATATKEPDDYRLAIDNLVWEYSLDEPKIYYINMIAEEHLSNFDLEVTLKFDDEQDEFHGVVFRRVDENHYYSFEISPLGEYVIYRNGENNKSNLVGPVYSSIILRGKDQFNKLRVKATDAVFEFSINDTPITSLTESTLPVGGVGLYTCTCNGSSSSSVSFYDLAISSLP